MRNTNRLLVLILICGALFGALAMSGCLGSGDTDGGPAGDVNFDGDAFVANGDTAGSLTLEVTDDEMLVSDVSGFSIQVRDVNGNGVPNIEIACDTELGLALVEPATGFELTDSGGHLSGKVGCEAPGSFILGCRLPLGGNLRKLVTVRCTGPVPVGFNGFPGAGGGGLGTDPSGGVDNEQTVRLVSISAEENGTDGSTSIDVLRGTCGTEDLDGDGTIEACEFSVEPFTDTLLNLSIVNETNETVFFNSFSYTIKSADSLGDLVSPTLALTSSGEVKPDGTAATFVALFLKAGAGDGSGACSSIGVGDRKSFTGRDINVPTDLGFKSVVVNVFGVTSQGEDITLTGRTALSFGNFDNCGA